MSIESDRVAELVGQEIDRQQLRYSELLVGLASGTLALIVSAIVQRPESRSINGFWCVVSLVLLVASIIASFSVLLAYGYAIRRNFLYEEIQRDIAGKLDVASVIDTEDRAESAFVSDLRRRACLKKQVFWKSILKWSLIAQSILFGLGEVAVLILVLWIAFSHSCFP